MASYIANNREALSLRHYIRKADGANHWFDFRPGVLERYRRRNGDDFCLIVFRSETEDAYILPYASVKSIFSNRYLDGRGRWHGKIIDGVLHLSPDGPRVNVRSYHSAHDHIRP